MIYTKTFLNDLLSHSKITNENSDHIIIRCIYCGDSYKHPDKGHLAISKHEPVFRCVRCEEAGHISRLYYDLTGIRKRIGNIIDKNKYDLDNYNRWSKYTISRIKKIININLVNQDFTKFKHKVDYLKSRLKNVNDFETLKDNMIVDIYSFIKDNNIIIPENKRKLFDYFHNNFIGFLSNNKSIILLRNTKPNSDFRYYVWKLINNINDFIVIDNLKDEKEKISLCLAEGFFDIINGRYAIDEHDIYVVATGKMFSRAIKFIMINKCITYFNKISILSDDDVRLNFYKKHLKSFYNLADTIDIYYNQLAKDFGEIEKVKTLKINLK